MFITFEGIDSCGKTTQIRLLAEWFDAIRIPYLFVREPGGTSISEHIRSVLLDTAHHDLTPVAELLLFSAARAQLVREKILPALTAGTTVVADRFYDSTSAYQGYGRGIDIDSIDHLNRLASEGLSPDMTIYLDIPVEESLARRSRTGTDADRMERADPAFYERVRRGYLLIAEQHGQRFVVIDGTCSVPHIADQIRAALQRRIDGQSGKE